MNKFYNAGFSCFCVYAGVWQASADWGTWILHTECVNSGWTPGCTVSGTLWQPRPNDPARDCTVHREVFYSCTATPSSHYHPFSLPFFPHPLSASPAPCFTSLFCPPSSLNFFQSFPSPCVFSTQPLLLSILSISVSITLLSTRQKLSAGILERQPQQTCQSRQNLFKYSSTLTSLSAWGTSFYCG